MKSLRCLFGFHEWHVRGRCITRAIVLANVTSHGGDDRVCERCGLEDNDMLNCHHEHRRIEERPPRWVEDKPDE